MEPLAGRQRAPFFFPRSGGFRAAAVPRFRGSEERDVPSRGAREGTGVKPMATTTDGSGGGRSNRERQEPSAGRRDGERSWPAPWFHRSCRCRSHSRRHGLAAGGDVASGDGGERWRWRYTPSGDAGGGRSGRQWPIRTGGWRRGADRPAAEREWEGWQRTPSPSWIPAPCRATGGPWFRAVRRRPEHRELPAKGRRHWRGDRHRGSRIG